MFHPVSLGAFFDRWSWQSAHSFLARWGSSVSIPLALMLALVLGTLKGTIVTSIVATARLVALVPLGIRVLRHGAAPNPRTAWIQSPPGIGVIALFFFLGPRA